MPTYQYECQKCGHVFEEFQKMSDPALKSCSKPKCKGRVKRLIGGGSGIIFKGSGFYTTDYRSKNYKEAAKKESGVPTEKSSSKADPASTRLAHESGEAGGGGSKVEDKKRKDSNVRS